MEKFNKDHLAIIHVQFGIKRFNSFLRGRCLHNSHGLSC